MKKILIILILLSSIVSAQTYNVRLNQNTNLPCDSVCITGETCVSVGTDTDGTNAYMMVMVFQCIPPGPPGPGSTCFVRPQQVAASCSTTMTSSPEAQTNCRCEAATTGLVAEYKFEGSGTTATDSVGNNDGTIYGATRVSGRSGNALEFDGNDYVSVPDSPSLDGARTISVWFYAHELAQQPYHVLLAKAPDSGWTAVYELTVTPSNIGPLNINEWYHYVAVYDGTNTLHYINGQLKFSETHSNPGSSNGDLFIGGKYTPPGGHEWRFKGIIDEVKIYGSALSATEIQTIYETCDPACTALEICDVTLTPPACACWPLSCAVMGWYCGSGSDGCGGTLDCGTCDSGETCLGRVCKKNNGQACTTGIWCVSGLCVHSVCRPEDPFCGDGVCDVGEDCGNCIPDCSSPYDHQGCFSNDLYWFDSCGGLGDFQDCGTDTIGTPYCDDVNENLVRDDTLNSCSSGACSSTSQTVVVETCSTDTLACSLGTGCVCSSGKYYCNDGNPKSCKDCSGGVCQGCAAICTKSYQSTGDNDGDEIDNECDTENTPADCNDIYDNDDDGLINDADPGCLNACTQCSECGDGFWNLCDETECNGCAADCIYKSGIRLAFIEVGNDCCVDSDGDGVCNVEDVCEGHNDSIDPDGDGNPNGCDLFPFDFDDDGSDDVNDCWDEIDTKLESNVCDSNVDLDVVWEYGSSVTRSCGVDECSSGIYFDYTDCDKKCSNNICSCECPLATQPHSGEDFDGDGYEDVCDFNITNPCSRESKGDNCNTLECPEASANFCSTCSASDQDFDGALDVCEDYDLEPCSILAPEDNCGGQSCGTGSPVFCNNCSGLDSDGDGAIDACDIENTPADCNDGFDNDGDALCDDYGCNGMDPDPGCVGTCASCDECGAGAFNFCEEVECEQSCGNCHYDSGWILSIGSFCCPDADADTICDEDDICPGHDDRIDTDQDDMPDGCDTCITEPLITTEPLELPSELSCNDGKDNDCDTLRDAEDMDCQCAGGTARCADGTCSDTCVNYPPCDNNGICNQSESCNCEDCFALQGSCVEDYACDPVTALCSNEPDLSPELCENSNNLIIQGTCDSGEQNCWAASIPLDVTIIGGGRCCGDDADETWSYKSNIDIDDLLVQETCYEGEWRVLSGTDVFYNLGIE